MFILKTRWLRDWRFRGRSVVTISFSHNLQHTTYYGSLSLYLRRLTINWHLEHRGVSVDAGWSKKYKPFDQMTAREKREIGIIDVRTVDTEQQPVVRSRARSREGRHGKRTKRAVD